MLRVKFGTKNDYWGSDPKIMELFHDICHKGGGRRAPEGFFSFFKPFESFESYYLYIAVELTMMNMAEYGSQRSQQPANVKFEPITIGPKSDIFD